MHTYQKKTKVIGEKAERKTVFEVGFFTITSSANPNTDLTETEHSWNRLVTFEHEIQAATYAHFLNGGNQPVELMDELLGKKIA